MPKIKTVVKGSLSHKMRSLVAGCRILTGVLVRRAIGKPLVPEWGLGFEYGTLYWRHQWNHAFSLPDIEESRAYMDCCYSLPDFPLVAVEIRPNDQPKGHWYIPNTEKNDLTMLYFHGGGYTFYLDATRHFIGLLAQSLGIRIFAPDYRLTPEYPHPAQSEDAVAAYQYLLAQGRDPGRIIIGGDSAGGHMTLMALVNFQKKQLPQPALALGLCPWTDTGRRGASQFGNDRYDQVQGYQTLQFGQWLKGSGKFTDEELSPMYQDYRGLAPVYLQAGGKEVLVDMIRDFAKALEKQGAKVRLDVWEHMTHDFQCFGSYLPESREAFECLQKSMAWVLQSGGAETFSATARTEVNTL